VISRKDHALQQLCSEQIKHYVALALRCGRAVPAAE